MVVSGSRIWEAAEEMWRRRLNAFFTLYLLISQMEECGFYMRGALLQFASGSKTSWSSLFYRDEVRLSEFTKGPFSCYHRVIGMDGLSQATEPDVDS